MKAKLWIHQKNFSEEEIMINSKDFPDIEDGAVVEIRDPELDLENCSPLLVQVKSFNSQSQQQLKDGAVSVSQAIASIFHLRMYSEVEIRVVRAEDVALDMIELTYKEQYFSRSDMQRLKGSLKNTCLYYTKKVKHVEMRAQVHELWSKGDKVSCGYVTEDTRVTFRSYTAQVNIFIQMSSEMWEFDNYGDLYFEKAVDGFLVDMFNEWKEKACSHDVTITLFSRTFYDSKHIGDFPMYMRECVQRHSSGYFYEDFYRVVVQNEKYDDWTKTLIELRKLFHEYNMKVVKYHEKQGREGIPSARNSTAAEGNVLEVFNMSLNVFEKFYLDRCFDRTGKLSTVITPGQGVFEVDRQLASITKHRTIDCGSSSDLVCMGEQPLHVVPLFKFTSKSSSTQNDYNIPHWINHSFYTSRSQAEKQNRGVFIPRIKMPPLISPKQQTEVPNHANSRTKRLNEPSRLPSDEVPFLDYDEYDAQIFKTCTQKPTSHILCNSYQAVKAMRVSRCSFSESLSGMFDVKTTTNSMPQSDEDILFMSHSFGGYPANKKVDVGPLRHVAGSLPDPVKYQRPFRVDYQPRSALFNPFTPSRLRFKVTSNRRRWAHAFPTDSQGDSVQMHHKSSGSFKNATAPTAASLTQQGNQLPRSSALMISKRPRPRKQSENSDYGEHSHYRQVIVSSIGSQSSTDSVKDYMRDRIERESTINFKDGKPYRSDSNVESYNDDVTTPALSSNRNGISGQITRSSNNSLPPGLYSRSSSIGRETVATSGDKGEGINWVWGLSGEQEWTPEIKTGVDWKSMIIPASLPITTDYFPDSQSLETDYVFKNYTLLPEDINSDSRADKSAQLSPLQVYKEMVTQRIAQGFQIVMLSKNTVSGAATALNSSPYQNSLRRRTKIEPTEEAIVSIGSIFHRLSVNGPKINATTYWPRHPYPPMSSHYIYRFQVPDSERYDVSWTDFVCSKLENYNWNHVDIYLCTKGEDANFDLTESLKHWRANFVLLPCNNHATKTIIDGVKRCDIYEEPSSSTQQQLLHDFLRFLEMLNKLRRPTQSHMPAKKEFSRKSSITVSPVVMNPNMDRAADGTAMSKNKSISRVTEGTETPPFGSYGVSGTNLDGSLRRTPAAMSEVPGNPLTTTGEENASEELPFNASSHLDDIVTAMLEPHGGLYFVKQQNQQQQNQFGPSILPNYCFIADEAIAWVKLHVEGMDTLNLAVCLLQKMVDEQLICHASGNHGHRFIQGFYLYYFCKEKKGDVPKVWSGYCTNREFEQEWMEVITHCSEEGNGDNRVRPFFAETVKSTGYDVPPPYEKTSHRFRQQESAVYKNVNVVVDPSGKSDRQEWGTGKYHANYTPTSAFELTIKWLVATGCILGDLVQSWSRRAGQYGFHFLPVPGDPFALPFTPGSDPLRGPIFVPLNIDCLKPKDMHLFDDFPPDTRDERLVLFQECILKRFGFIAEKCPIKTTNHGTLLSESQPKYVHCSGGMFAMIPDTKTTSPRNRDGTHCRFSGGSLKEYIAMQSGLSTSASEGIGQESFYQVGFLWSWNYMLSKRWRSPNTGDEHYQDQMLEDFRAFCSNTDNRLEEYWNMCWQEYEESKQPMVLDQVTFRLDNNTGNQHIEEARKDDEIIDVLS